MAAQVTLWHHRFVGNLFRVFTRQLIHNTHTHMETAIGRACYWTTGNPSMHMGRAVGESMSTEMTQIIEDWRGGYMTIVAFGYTALTIQRPRRRFLKEGFL